MKQTALELNSQLMQKISQIKLNDAASILGSSANSSQLNNLRTSAAKLQEALSSSKPYDEIMERYESLAGSVDTAGVMGLVSESEIVQYYELIDKIWAAIEHEKAPPDS